MNKVRDNCTLLPLGMFDDAQLNAAILDKNHFIVMKKPNDLFEIDDSYFYAGNVCCFSLLSRPFIVFLFTKQCLFALALRTRY